MNGNRRANQNANTGPNLVSFLFQLQISVKMFHWQTRSYAVHVASGQLFDRVVELTDAFIEQYIGTYGRPRMASNASVSVPNMTKSAMLSMLRDAMSYLSTRVPRDSHLQNLRDELTGELAKMVYLLTLR